MSILWILFACNILISLLNDFANMMKIPNSFMAMTILNFGNNFPEMILNIRFAKLGYGEMAISSSLSSPLFGYLVGLGSAFIKMNLRNGAINFNLFSKRNIINILCLIFLFLHLINLEILIKIQKNHLNLKSAYYMFFFYIIFFVIICFIVFL